MNVERKASIKPGVIFPTREVGGPAQIRDFAQAARDMGFDHIVAYDHVLGASEPAGNNGYTNKHPFHEPFTLFSYIARDTEGMQLMTGTLVLPQRQTALVAKQAAEVDFLSDGRLVLGVSVGTNQQEFEALGENFNNRGRRIKEQIAVLRKLWTTENVIFEGRDHTLTEVGINPLPVQRPIPIWIGGWTDRVVERTATLGDGYMPMGHPDEAEPRIELLRARLEVLGKNPEDFPIMGGYGNKRVQGPNTMEAFSEILAKWKALGVSHVAFGTMGNGFTTLDEHLAHLKEYKEMFDSQTT